MKRKNKNLNLPTHVAIIMDGNGRWAKKYGLPRSLGHKKGAQNLIEIVLYANELNIKYLTVFAFSTENWNRPQDEIDYLMEMPIKFFDEFEKHFMDYNIKIKVIGFKDNLPNELIAKIEYVENKTKDNTGLTFIVALNYGSRQELLSATKQIAKDVMDDKIVVEDITAELFEEYLLTREIPPVDLLIRTSGELRISNFLLWQISYSELYFTKVLWPAFSKRKFMKAVKSYSNRDRRFGAVKE